jgi:hypothetical protein
MHIMSTPAIATRRVVLLPEPREGREAKIRRYRLARLRLDETREPRFSHLKRSYD